MRIAQLFAGIACAVVVAGCNGNATSEQPTATPVRVAAATTGPAAPSIRTNGLLANKDEFRLGFKVGGVIRRRRRRLRRRQALRRQLRRVWHSLPPRGRRPILNATTTPTTST